MIDQEVGTAEPVPPFVQQILGVLVRSAVVAGAAYLAGHSDIKLSDDSIGALVAYLLPIAVVLVWSLRSKFIGRQKLLTAAAQAGRTEQQIEADVKNPRIATPSVMTQKNELPT